MDEVYDGLWISDITAVREEGTSQFDVVVTVCQDSVEDNVGCDYHHFNMADGAFSGYGGDHSYEMFEETASLILDNIDNGNTILVHCHAGQSRSASTSIAAIAVHEGRNYGEAYDMVEEERPQIHPDGLLRKHAIRFIEENSDVNHELF